MAPSPLQIIIIAFVILLLFGAGRLSDLGKGLGEGIRNFKKGIGDGDDNSKDVKVLPTEGKTTASDEKQSDKKSS